MQKFLRTLTLMALLAVPWVSNAQTLTVANGTNTNSYVPFYGYMMDVDQHNQIVYPADSLTAMVNKNITSLTFYISMSSSYWNSSTTVSLGIVNDVALTSLNTSVTLTPVWTGNLSYSPTDGTLVFTFDNDFLYTGGNLLVDLNSIAGQWRSNTTYGVNVTWNAAYCYSSSRQFLPKTTFTYENPSACAKPSGVYVNGVTATSATINWTIPEGQTATYTITDGSNINVITTASGASSYTFDNLTPQTTYSGLTIVANCGGSDGSSVPANVPTFRTTAIPVNLPYSTGFEAGQDVNWEYTQGTTNIWTVGSATNNGGTKGLYISNDNGTTNAYSNSTSAVSYASRLFNFSQDGDYAVSFDWKADGESTWDYLRAFLVPGGVEFTADQLPGGVTSTSSFSSQTPTGWIDLGNGKLNLTTEWQSMQATASEVTAGNYNLVFIWANDGSGGFNPPVAIDNVSVSRITCPAPEWAAENSLTNLTTTSATITWTPRGSETSWLMRINDGAWQTVTSTTQNLTLTPNTGYTVQVRAYCGAGDTSLVLSGSFRTPCEDIATADLPYTMGFEPTEEGVYCWDVYRVGHTNIYWYHLNTTPDNYWFQLYAYGSNYTYAVLPQFEADVNNLQLSLDIRKGNSSYAGTIQIGVMTDPEDITTFTKVNEFTPASTEWETVSTDFADYTGNGTYIALLSRVSGYSYNYADIDNVVVAPELPCHRVKGLTASVVNSDISFTWTGRDGQTKWDVAVLTADTQTVVRSAMEVEETHYTFTGLDGNTDYLIRVQANCGDDGLSEPVYVMAHTDPEVVTVDLQHPYSCNFENATQNNGQWVLNSPKSASYSNEWMIGTAATTSGNALYVSDDHASYHYTNASGTKRTYAFVNVMLGAGQFEYSFDIKSPSTNSSHYARVFLLPASYNLSASSTPSNSSAPYYSANIYNVSDWQTVNGVFNLSNEEPVQYRLVVMWYNSGSSNGEPAAIDNISLKQNSCLQPSTPTVVASATTTDSITLNWTDNNETNPGQWQVIYGTPGFNPNTGKGVLGRMMTTTNQNYAIGGLKHSTTYAFRVRAKCSATEWSAWSAEKTAATLCKSTITADDFPFTETFDAALSGTCWRGASKLVSEVFAGQTLTIGNIPSNWGYQSDVNNGIPAGHYRNNIYGTSRKDWLITPSFELPADAPAQLSFDAAFTVYTSSSNAPAAGFENNSTQAFMVLISTDDGETWPEANAIKWQNEGGQHTLAELASSDYVNQVVDLTAYQGQTVRFAFYAQSTTSGGDNNMHIDNVIVDYKATQVTLDANSNQALCNAVVQPVIEATGSYKANQNKTWVITPATPGKAINLSGSIDLEFGDHLMVYQGMGDNKVLVKDYTDTTANVTIANTVTDWTVNNGVTLVFTTNGSNSTPHTGFRLKVNCACPQGKVVNLPLEAPGSYSFTLANGDIDYRENHAYADAAADNEENFWDKFPSVVAPDCDSVELHHLVTIHPYYTIEKSANLCTGTTYELMGETLTTGGVYTRSDTTIYGADSTITLSLQQRSTPTVAIRYNGLNTTVVNDFCLGNDMPLTARSNSNAVRFIWEDSTFGAERTVVPLGASTYTVQAIDTVYGCESTVATLNVTTVPSPMPMITANKTEICLGDTVTLTVTDSSNLAGVTFTWSTGETGNSITVVPTTVPATVYTVAAATATCENVAEQTIVVNALPTVAITASESAICLGDSVTLTAENVNGYTYQWANGTTGLENALLPNTAGNMTTTLTVTDQKNCVNNITSSAVVVRPSYDMTIDAIECVDKLPYIFGNASSLNIQELDTDGVYTNTFTLATGCDSIVTLNFSVLDTAVYNTYRELCYGTEFTFGDSLYQQTYVATTDTVISYFDTLGQCPAYYNLYLTVHPTYSIALENSVCDSLVWNEQVYDTTGHYVQNLLTNYNCDSIVSLDLVVRYSNAYTDNQDVCDQLKWHGTTYTEPVSGVTFITKNVANCDSVVTLNLTAVRHSSIGYDQQFWCAPDTWIDGKFYNMSELDSNVAFKAPVLNTEGCDSTVILLLSLNVANDTLLWADTTVCDEYVVDTVGCNGIAVPAYFRNSDSIEYRAYDETGKLVYKRINLEVNTTTVETRAITACAPFTWPVNYETYYRDTTVMVGGEDCSTPMITLHYTAIQPEVRYHMDTMGSMEYTFDKGDYNFNDIASYVPAEEREDNVVDLVAGNYSIAFNYTGEGHDTLDANGCALYDTLVLTVNKQYVTVMDTQYLCESAFTLDTVTGSPFNGMYTYTIEDAAHDSVMTIRYSGNPSIVIENNVNYVAQTVTGRDSIVNIPYVIFPTVERNDYPPTTFMEFTWKTNGNTYKYVDSIAYKDHFGSYTFAYNAVYDTVVFAGAVEREYNGQTFLCDSVVYLNINIYDTIRDSVKYNHCNSFTVDGQTYYSSQIFIKDTVQDFQGQAMPVRHYEIHTVGEPTWVDHYVVSSDPYYWPAADSNITETGVYDHNNGLGDCVDVERLHFTKVDTIGVALCDTNVRTFSVYGVSFDTADIEAINAMPLADLDRGVFYYHYVVDSIENVDTIITVAFARGSYEHITPVAPDACDSYTWMNGVTYTQDTDSVVYNYTDVYGCPSADTLFLTLQHNSNEGYNVISCVENDFYWTNGKWDNTIDTVLSKSGTYTHKYNNAAGCPSVDTLYLTISQKDTESVQLTVCDNYAWENVASVLYSENSPVLNANDSLLFTESDSVIAMRYDENGCTSIDTLVLTIKNSSTRVWDNIVNASSYLFDGVQYTIPADEDSVTYGPFTYTVAETNAAGCDSIEVMTLKMYRGEIVRTDVANYCGDYTWEKNGHIYTYLTPAERQAAPLGAALYFDRTANDYVYTNPTVYDTFANGGIEKVYVLYLTLSKALVNYDTVPVAVPLSWDSYLYKKTATEQYNLDLSGYTKDNVTEDTTLVIEYKYGQTYGSYCDSINYITVNLHYNYAKDSFNVCATVDSVVLGGTTYKFADLGMDNTVDTDFYIFPDVVTNADTLTEMHTYTKVMWNRLQMGEAYDTACVSKTYHGITYTATAFGKTDMDVMDTMNCDSVVTRHLTLFVPTTQNDSVVACDDHYEWGGHGETAAARTKTASGIYTFQLPSEDFEGTWSCAAYDKLNLTLRPAPEVPDSIGACEKWSFTYHNYITDKDDTLTYTQADVVDDSVTVSFSYATSTVTVAACQVEKKMHLTILNHVVYDSTLTVVANSYKIGDSTYTESANDIEVLAGTAANGCDSILRIDLDLQKYFYTDVNATACGRFVWEQNGHTYEWITPTTGVLYRDVTTGTNVTAAPVDTNFATGEIFRLNLTMNNGGIGYQNTEILLSQNRNEFRDNMNRLVTTWDFDDFTGDSTVHAVLDLSAPGTCDSVVYFTINVHYNFTVDSAVFCASENGKPFTWENISLAKPAAGMRDTMEVILNEGGITEQVKQMRRYTRGWNNTSVVKDTVCDQLVYNGHLYKNTGNYSDTIKNADVNVCDSVVTLQLVVNKNSGHKIEFAVCDSAIWWNEGVNNVGDKGDSAWYFATDTNNGITRSYLDANKCASIDTLSLTIWEPASHDTVVTLCVDKLGSYTWEDAGTIHANGATTTLPLGKTQFKDTLYGPIYPSAHSCNSVDTLYLTLNLNYETVVDTFVSESFLYHLNRTGLDTLVTTDGTQFSDYYDTVANGCDSTVKITVHIGNTYNRVVDTVVCHDYTWVNDTTYVWISPEERAAHTVGTMSPLYKTSTGRYIYFAPTFNKPNAGTWDSVYVLRLTLTENYYGNEVVNLPVSTLENGVYVYAEGTTGETAFNYGDRQYIDSASATYQYEIHFGATDRYCDSIINLTVNVNNNYVNGGTDAICAYQTTYEWHDSTYAIAAKNVNVVSYDTLYWDDTVNNTTEYRILTLKPVSNSVERREACNVYTWNGTTYGDKNRHDGTTQIFRDTKVLTSISNGCDSIVSLVLTVHYDSSQVYTKAVECDSNTYTFPHATEARTYYASTKDTNAWMKSYAGSNMQCLSIDTVYVNVVESYDTIYNVVACDNYTWINNKSYVRDTNIGYTHLKEFSDSTFGTVVSKNCSVRDSLVLDIKNNSNSGLKDTVCDVYPTGIAYYKVNMLNISRLSSWMNPDAAMPDDTSVYADGLDFDTLYLNLDGDLTESGLYWHLYTNADGCHSIDTLVLTVNENSNQKIVFAPVCDTFEYRYIREYTVKVGTGTSAHDSIVYDTTNFVATESDSVLFEYVTNNGCPSVDTLVFTVNHADSSTVVDTLVCDMYEWYDLNGYNSVSNSTVYNFDTVVKQYYYTENGCDSIVTVNVTIGHGITYNVEDTTACGHYTWIVNNDTVATYTESINTSYRFTNPNHGCDSIVYLRLTIAQPSIFVDTTVNEAAMPFVWNGHVYNEPGIYTDTLGGTGECDSIAELHLAVRNTVVLNDQICFGKTSYNKFGFSLDSVDLSQPGMITVFNADSTVVLNLDINFEGYINTTIVPAPVCDTFRWNHMDGTSELLRTSGTYLYIDTLRAPNGCFYADTVKLVVNHNQGIKTVVNACGSYTWRGQEYTESGEYYFHFSDTNYCQSADTLVLTINDVLTSSFDTAACGSFVWDGRIYTATGSYEYTYQTVNGCDSIVTMNLTITDQVETSIAKMSCGSYTWNGITYSESGIYTQSFEAENGCDSIVTLTLIVGTVVTGDTSAVACDNFEWHGETYSQSGDYTYTFVADETCDSVVTLHLTINNSVNVPMAQTVCGSLTWNGSTYTESGVYSYTTTGVNGCDSTTTLTLTVNEPVNTTVTASNCDSYTWYDSIYTTTGTYTHAITDANGCAATATLNLTIHNSVTGTITAENCVSYTWNNQTYYGSGNYTQTFQTVNGCDSTVTLALTISQPTTGTVTYASCSDYVWNDMTCTASGIYTYNTTNAAGCDSVATLIFTRLQSVATTVNETACGSYTWNGQTYTTSGTYNHSYTATSGCDSLVTLVLTVNQPINTTVTASNCDSYTWYDVAYTTSGTYTHAITDANGCAATATLNLTIYNSASTTVNETACNSYSWNGNVYTNSGNYSYQTTTTAGCDSTVTLNLTITAPVEVTIAESACSSYEWNGETYTTSGTYTYTTTSAATGCDSVTTLVLTINQPVYTNLVVTADGGYNWNGEVLTESGVYTYTTTAANGCDSVVTLELTVNPLYTVTLVSDNTTMGTVSESGIIVENGYFTAVATPNDGYRFVAWKNGSEIVSTTATYVFQVTEDITLTAVFEENVGIDDVDMDNVTIYSANSTIFVKGVEGQDVHVYDVNGRMMYRELNATENLEFRMTATGVYLVKVGNAPAKRVVVVR